LTLCVLVAVSFAITTAASTAADSPFPSKPLRIIVTFPAGGTFDLVARVIAQRMQLGQNVIVENRPGGGSVIGTELVARAPGDGHMLLSVGPSFTFMGAVRDKLPYDTEKDFRAVALAIELPMVVAVNISLPVKTMKEYLALARARPGEISYGTAGPSGLHTVLGESLKQAAKVNITLVPFQGEAPAVIAATGGHITGVVVNVFSTAPFIKAGKLRGLAVTSTKREAMIPDVPTAREAGTPELEASNWNGYVVPAATPDAVVARLNAEINRVLNMAEVRDNLRTQGLMVAPGSSEQFAVLIKSEGARYSKIAKAANIKAE
jgi:tripartite-type tricarboxylate transporter receptor subunit TctC